MDKVIVTAIGGLLIAFIYWFFFGKKESEAIATSDSLEVKVNGGYNPSIIRVKNGKTTTLSFLRTDPNTCLEEVVFPTLKIKKFLPLNTPVEVLITPESSGEIDFHCGMNMFHGKVIVS
jgi:plastocyanin domain-containing protein